MHMHSDVGREFASAIYENTRYAGVRKVAQQEIILYCSRLLCGARRTQTSIAVCWRWSAAGIPVFSACIFKLNIEINECACCFCRLKIKFKRTTGRTDSENNSRLCVFLFCSLLSAICTLELSVLKKSPTNCSIVVHK